MKLIMENWKQYLTEGPSRPTTTGFHPVWPTRWLAPNVTEEALMASKTFGELMDHAEQGPRNKWKLENPVLKSKFDFTRSQVEDQIQTICGDPAASGTVGAAGFVDDLIRYARPKIKSFGHGQQWKYAIGILFFIRNNFDLIITNNCKKVK